MEGEWVDIDGLMYDMGPDKYLADLKARGYGQVEPIDIRPIFDQHKYRVFCHRV